MEQDSKITEMSNSLLYSNANTDESTDKPKPI